MVNSLAKKAMKGTAPTKKKSALSTVAPVSRRQSEGMSGARSMDPNQGDMEMRAREDMRVLHEAHKIKSDKARVTAVKNHMMSLSEALSGSVTTTDKKVGRR